MKTIDNTINIPGPAPGSRIGAFYAHPEGAHPDGNGGWPPVIVYFDAPGMREELREMARRIAAEGYFCLLPDMYWRLGELCFRLSHRDAAMGKVISAARETLTHDHVMADTRALIDWLDRHSHSRRGKIGVIGYCQGGRFVVAAAGHFADRVIAGATLYGTEMVTDRADSPHLLAGGMACEFYFGFASHDPLVPPSVVPGLEKALGANPRVTYRVETFSDTRHGFCFPERDAYNRDAAETAWVRVFDLLKRRLAA